MTPQNMLLWLFGYWLFWAASTWINTCRERLSLNSPYLPKDRSSKRNSIVIGSAPQGFHWPGKIDSYHRWGEKATPHPENLCHKLSHLPSILLRTHSSFLKIIYSPLRGLLPPSPFPIKMVFKTEFQATLRSYSFSPGCLMCAWSICVNKLLFVFLWLICLLLPGFQPRMQKSRGQIIFSFPTQAALHSYPHLKILSSVAASFVAQKSL